MATTMTIRKQVLAGYAVPLLATLAMILVAVLALQSVLTAKNQVIDRDARLVSDAHRTNAAVHERANASRGYLLTRDAGYLAQIQEAEGRTEEAVAALESRVYTEAGRQLVAQVRPARDRWLEESAAVMRDAQRPGITTAAIGTLFAERQAPALLRLETLLNEFIALQEEQIDSAVADSDSAAQEATNLVWALGAVAFLAALLVGLWLTNRISRRLSGLALTVDAAAAEVLAGTTQQVSGSAQQAAAVQETVSTVEELVQTAQQSAERARAVAEQAQRAAEVAHDGTRAVAESAAGMVAIREQVDTTARTVVELAERAQAISDIVSAVEEIAGQTHLLALNAAIEAARAGEHGKGFSVVAGEVRGLAGQSRRATAQVSQILGEIQQGTTTAVMASEEGTKRVADGVSRTEQAGQTIRELSDNVASAAEAGEQIAASSVQQAVVTGQIGEAMRNIEQVMEQNTRSAREAEQAARDLHRVSAELKELVGAAADGR
ncbi:MAG: methyl-accepting chemotaxis protein [Mycobacteriales bacterium]